MSRKALIDFHRTNPRDRPGGWRAAESNILAALKGQSKPLFSIGKRYCSCTAGCSHCTRAPRTATTTD